MGILSAYLPLFNLVKLNSCFIIITSRLSKPSSDHVDPVPMQELSPSLLPVKCWTCCRDTLLQERNRSPSLSPSLLCIPATPSSRDKACTQRARQGANRESILFVSEMYADYGYFWAENKSRKLDIERVKPTQGQCELSRFVTRARDIVLGADRKAWCCHSSVLDNVSQPSCRASRVYRNSSDYLWHSDTRNRRERVNCLLRVVEEG